MLKERKKNGIKIQLRTVLVVEDSEGKKIIDLDKNIYSVGRSVRNSIVLNSKSVSRHHATLLRLPYKKSSLNLFQIVDGDLQGNYSTNGLLINGLRSLSHTLNHKDIIVFGDEVKASYLVIDSELSEQEIFEYEDNITSYNCSTTSIDPLETLLTSYQTFDPSMTGAILRLASFPELLPNPIIEIDLSGEITYLNPSALIQFANLQKDPQNSTILSGLVEAVHNENKDFFVREVEIENIIYEQSVYYIPESSLIRSYLVDITKRKQEELELQQHRENLQQLVEERTKELQQKNYQLEQAQAYLQQLNTEQSQLLATIQESEERFRQLAENIREVFFLSSVDQMLYISPAYQEIWGCSCESVYQQPESWFEIIHPEDRDRLQIAWKEQTQNCQPLDEEYRIVRSDQSIRWIRTRTFPIQNETGVIYRIPGISEDITESKQAEVELRKALEKEKELSELKSRFVAMTSHEFRTPMSTILSSTELLELFSDKLSEQKKNQHFSRIQIAIKKMTSLLDDVLLFGKAEAGKLQFQPKHFDLMTFCQNLVEEMQFSAGSNYQITFSGSRSCKNTYMDEKLIQHILTNLLSNAIKYSPAGGNINLELDCEQQIAIFKIQDSGIGIPITETPNLFKPFERASNVGTLSGTGLGLAIVKNCVDIHGGKITVESELGIGTKFVVNLPYYINIDIAS